MPGWALGATPTLLEHHRDVRGHLRPAGQPHRACPGLTRRGGSPRPRTVTARLGARTRSPRVCRCGITERHSPAHSPGPGTLTLAGTPLPDEGATLPRRPLLRLVRVTTSHPTERWVAARRGRDENVSSASGPPQESPQAQAAGRTPPPRAPAPRGRDRAPCRQQTSRRRTPHGTGQLTRRLAKQGCNLGDYEMPDRKVRTDTPASRGGRHIRATAETRRPAGGKERRTRGSKGRGPWADSDTDTGTCVRDGGDASPSEASDGHHG